MSSDPNHRSMLERINSVFGSITNDVPYQFTKFYQIKADEMRKSLWSEYVTARDFYIKTAEYFCNKPVPLTPPLQSPFLYIYLYKQKSKQVLKTVYGIVKKTAHPTCPVMPPAFVLTATVSA